MGVFSTFFLPSITFRLSPCLGDGPIQAEILSQGPLDPNNRPNVAALATFLTTKKYAMLEYVKQKLYDVRVNKADRVCM